MNNEQYTAAEFIRGVTWAPSMQARIEIAGVPYVVGELLADVATDKERKLLNEVFSLVISMARDGDGRAQKLITKMADQFVYKHCPPEPEPEEPSYLKAEERGQFDAQTERLPRWIHLTA